MFTPELAECRRQAPKSENSGLFRSLEEIVAHCARDAFGDLPTPPKSVHRFGYDAMNVGEGRRVVAEYNVWATLWNRAERGDCSLPLSPPWSYAESAHWDGGPESALMFRVRGEQRWGVIRIEGWNRWGDGLSCCRPLIDFERVRWAGWEKPQPEPEAEPAPRVLTPLDHIREAARTRPRSYWRASPQWKGRFQ